MQSYRVKATAAAVRHRWCALTRWVAPRIRGPQHRAPPVTPDEELHDASPIGSGAPPLKPLDFDLDGLLEAVAVALPRGLTLSASNGLGAGAQVWGDADRLRNVITRLLAQLVEGGRGDELGLFLSVARYPAPDHDRVRFDLGLLRPGRMAELAALAFQAARPGPGSGSEALVMGGSLAWAKGRDGDMHCRLIVELPRAAAAHWREPAPVSQAAYEASLRGLRIVLAEDHQVNAELLVEQLEALGASAIHAVDGVQACAAVLTEPRPDIVLMDCQMPQLDGFEATRSIRAEEARQGWPAIPIIALTALAMDTERKHCLAMGMNAHLVKPFSTHQLARAIYELMPSAPPSDADGT